MRSLEQNAGPCASDKSDSTVKAYAASAGLFASGEKNKQSAIEHVFHGTAPTNVDSILKAGMNPRLRRVGADFFATEATRSLDFAKPVKFMPYPVPEKKLLIFLVLTLPPGFNSRSGVVVTMEKVEYELPIADVTVRWDY